METKTELDVLKELPGYKAILRSVLKSQIQLLLEQLSDNVGDESIILTASVNDGSLSHLGSSTGKGFIDGRDEIKSQFLGYCLKSHHMQGQQQHQIHRDSETDNGTALHQGRPSNVMPQHLPRRYRKRPSPYSLSNQNINPQVNAASLYSRVVPKEEVSEEAEKSGYMNDKPEQSDESGYSQPGSSGASDQPQDLSENKSEEAQNDVGVKQENDTSEMGENSAPAESWGQGYGEEGGTQTGEDGAYSRAPCSVDSAVVYSFDYAQQVLYPHYAQQVGPMFFRTPRKCQCFGICCESSETSGQAQSTSEAKNMVALGGIAFPGLDNSHHDFSQSMDLSPTDLKKVLYPEDSEMFHRTKSFYDSFTTQSRNQSGLKPQVNSLSSMDLLDSLKKGGVLGLKSALNENMSENFYTPPTPPTPVSKRGRPRKEANDSLPPGFIRPTGISIGDGYVKCNICGKILKASSMFTHKQVHLGIKNYSCEYCGKSFTQKGPLITHKRIHTGEKPYTCPNCLKPFAAQSGLYQHSRRCKKAAFNLNSTL